MRTVQKEKLAEYPVVSPRRQRHVPRPFRKGWLIAYKINRTIRSTLALSEVGKLDKIEGHLHPKEAMTLFFFAYHPTKEGRVVEIGSFKGKSTAWIATAIKLVSINDKVVAIDPHINVGEGEAVPKYEEPSSYEAFLKNLEKLSLLDYVEPIRQTSESAVKTWNEKIRLLFIDGSHRYEDVLLDLRLWEPWVVEGGIIIVHDTNPDGTLQGVNRAIDEYIKPSKRFKRLLELSNLTVFKKMASG